MHKLSIIDIDLETILMDIRDEHEDILKELLCLSWHMFTESGLLNKIEDAYGDVPPPHDPLRHAFPRRNQLLHFVAC